jgi:bacterioferritin-associated ferredoxin
MYICLCNALTDGQIKDALAAGAKKPRDVYAACNCAGQCGNCARTIQVMIREQATEPAGLATVQ